MGFSVEPGSLFIWNAAGVRGPLDASGLRRVFLADSVWGLAALLWISTGLWRLLGGPMVTLIGWRVRAGRGAPPDTRRAPLLARISFAQAWIVVLMVFAATAVARGWMAGRITS